MKSELISKILYIIALIFIVLFLILTVIDYTKYDAITNSAPFSAFVLLRAIELLLPGVILFIISKLLIKNKQKKS